MNHLLRPVLLFSLLFFTTLSAQAIDIKKLESVTMRVIENENEPIKTLTNIIEFPKNFAFQPSALPSENGDIPSQEKAGITFSKPTQRPIEKK